MSDTESENEDFAALFAESEAAREKQKPIRAGDSVRGRVLAIGEAQAFIALGGKSEGVIDLGEFRDPETGEVKLAVGDLLTATITDDGSRSGTIVLKRTIGRGGHLPGELEQAYAHGIPVEGTVTGLNKGGFDVQVAGQRAFCPASQIDLRRADPAQYVGQRLQFRLTKIDGGGRNITVSRRALLEEEAAVLAAETWKTIEVGAVVKGKVVSVRDFGAFVDLGGVEGLIHVSELSRRRVEHPSELLSEGQEVEAQILKIEPDPKTGKQRIGLSLRALEPDPWSDAAERFPVGSTVRGTVRRLEAFGAFVEIAPGMDGLVHVSRLTDRRVSHPRQVVSPGDEVDVTVMEVDPAKRRIGLSMIGNQRRAEQAEAAAEAKDTQSTMARLKESKGFGTFADLLAGKKKD